VNTGAEYCTLCGRPATAARHGDGTIAVCGECAANDLPALIVDAVDLPADWNAAKRLVERVECRTWRGLVYRLLKQRAQK